jgi:hypothetical protein
MPNFGPSFKEHSYIDYFCAVRGLMCFPFFRAFVMIKLSVYIMFSHIQNFQPKCLHWVNFVFCTGPGTFPVQKTPASATEQIRFGRSRLTLLEPSRQFLALVHPPTLLSFFLSLWRLQRTIIGCRSVSCWPGRCGSFRLETCDESTDMIRIGKLGRHVLDILYSDVVSK